MMDDSDTDFAALATLSSGSGCGLIVGIVIVIIVAVIVSQNKDECAQKHCDVGTPKLMAHECLCVSGAK